MTLIKVAELPQVHGSSISGMNPNCLYAGPGNICCDDYDSTFGVTQTVE